MGVRKLSLGGQSRPNNHINSKKNVSLLHKCMTSTIEFSNINFKICFSKCQTQRQIVLDACWICNLLLLDKLVDLSSLEKWKRRIELPRLGTSYLHFTLTLLTKKSIKGPRIWKSAMWFQRLDSNSVTCIFSGKVMHKRLDSNRVTC